jgi:hypothetical protein
MMRQLNRLLTFGAVVGICLPQAVAGETSQGGAGGTYQVVKACSLVTAAEVKKIAPWPSHLDQFAKPEEEPLGTRGSSCNYPTVFVQVMAFNQGTIDAAKKSGAQEAVAGVGDEAYVRNNRNRYAELITRAGPHLLTLQLNIGTGKKFEDEKPTLIELAKLFVTRLRGK